MDFKDRMTGGSTLTTKELQENLTEEKRKQRPVRLLFEVSSAQILQDSLKKHVVYTVVVMRSGSFDAQRVALQRRYSDFWLLHQQLQQEVEEVEEVALPPKLLTGNFSPDGIQGRRLALQDYLGQLFSVRAVRHSPRFAAFFTEAEQRRAHSLLRGGRFEAAAEQLRAVLEIQKKLLPWQNASATVPTLSAIAVCHRDLDEPERAFGAAQGALPAARRYNLRSHRVALLEALVDLGYQLGRPVAHLQEELVSLRDQDRGHVSSLSLKEMVVREFL